MSVCMAHMNSPLLEKTHFNNHIECLAVCHYSLQESRSQKPTGSYSNPCSGPRLRLLKKLRGSNRNDVNDSYKHRARKLRRLLRLPHFLVLNGGLIAEQNEVTPKAGGRAGKFTAGHILGLENQRAHPQEFTSKPNTAITKPPFKECKQDHL